MYNTDYFIKKFMAIPEEEWITHNQQDGEGKRCAYGHCMPESERYAGNMQYRGYGHGTDEGRALSDIFGPLGVAKINNGEHPGYKQPTPKQRILAALMDIKAKEDKENKVRTVYVAVTPTIVEQAKDMVLN